MSHLAKLRLPPVHNNADAAIAFRDIETHISRMHDLLSPLTETGAVDTTGDIELADGLLLADATAGNITLTLPSASRSHGHIFRVKKIDASGNTVTVASSDLIDGAASVVLTTQYSKVAVQSDGSTYWVI